MNTEDVNAIRALNISRLRHKPTYVALRSLLDDGDFESHSSQVAGMARHKLMAKKDWRYFSYPMLKDVNGGDPIYRTFMIGSPFTLIAESALLSMLSNEKAFQKSDFVFSYLWPHSAKTGHNYSFYRYGYLKRNDAVRKAIAAHKDNVAVINDIRTFYPSIFNRLGRLESTSN